jgi:hypothetical protein
MKNSWKQFLRSSTLKKKIGITLGLVVIYKLLSVIPSARRFYCFSGEYEKCLLQLSLVSHFLAR